MFQRSQSRHFNHSFTAPWNKHLKKTQPKETKHIDGVPGSMRTSCAPGRKNRVWYFIWKTKLLLKVTTTSSSIIHIALKNLRHFYLIRKAILSNSKLQVQCLFALGGKKSTITSALIGECHLTSFPPHFLSPRTSILLKQAWEFVTSTNKPKGKGIVILLCKYMPTHWDAGWRERYQKAIWNSPQAS